MSKKKILLTCVVLIAATLIFLKFQTSSINLYSQKDFSISFDSEKEHELSGKTILNEVERKYQIPNKYLSFITTPKIINHEGVYKFKILDTENVFHEKKINLIVNFLDRTGPTIKQVETEVSYADTISPIKLCQVTDKTDGIEPDSNIKLSTINTYELGEHILYVEAEDRSGNKTNKNFRISVLDKEEPSITGLDSTTITTKDVKNFNAMDNITGFDNVDGDITKKIFIENGNIPDTPGVFKIIYKLKDSSGNETKSIRTITVVRDLKVASSVTEEKTAHSQSESRIQPIQEISTIQFLGVTIPFTHSNNADAAPAIGCGTWTGSGSVDDNKPTHFIGHNPGDFSMIMNITTGTPITVADDQGHIKTYYVYEVLDVNDEGINVDNNTDDAWPRIIDEGGERISLQTCINDNVNRIILAR